MPLSAAAVAVRAGHSYDFLLFPLEGERGVHVNRALLCSKWEWFGAHLRWAQADTASSLRLQMFADCQQVAAVVEGVILQDWGAALARLQCTTPSTQYCSLVYALGNCGLIDAVKACERYVLTNLEPEIAVQWTPRVALNFSERFHRKVRDCVNGVFPGPLCQTAEWAALCIDDAAHWLGCNDLLHADEKGFLVALAWWGQTRARRADVQRLLRTASCFRRPDGAREDESLFAAGDRMRSLVRDERLWRQENYVVEERPRPWMKRFHLFPCDGKADWDGLQSNFIEITTDSLLTIAHVKKYIIQKFDEHASKKIANIELSLPSNGVILVEEAMTIADLANSDHAHVLEICYSYT